MKGGEFGRFLVTGGVAAFVNLGSRYVLNRFMPFELAIVIAYAFGMATAYALARLFVFQASGRSVASEMRRFFVVNLFSLVLVWAISISLARFVFPAVGFSWHAEDVAHFLGVMAPAVASYFGHRFYTFASAAR